MRIVPYDGEESIEDLNTLSIIIKAVPFEDGFVPAYSMIAPDDTTFNYLFDKPRSPKENDWDSALKYWNSLPSDIDAK